METPTKPSKAGWPRLFCAEDNLAFRNCIVVPFSDSSAGCDHRGVLVEKLTPSKSWRETSKRVGATHDDKLIYFRGPIRMNSFELCDAALDLHIRGLCAFLDMHYVLMITCRFVFNKL